MDYYIRVFCIADRVPPLTALLDWLNSHELTVRVDPPLPRAEMESGEWKTAPLAYQKARQPIVLECRRNTGANSLAQKEIDDFLERIGSPGKSHVKRRIVEHLKATKFIVACRLPVDEMGEAGWDANGQILTFFRDHTRALIQADREGFYEGSALVLKLE